MGVRLDSRVRYSGDQCFLHLPSMFVPTNLGPTFGYIVNPKSRRVKSLTNLPSGSCRPTNSRNFVKQFWAGHRVAVQSIQASSQATERREGQRRA